MSRIRIGISGWQYDDWQGRFYPDELRQRDRLAYLADRFPTVEINGTFYSLKQPQHFRRYYEQTPRDFRFAVKGGRFITHMKRLKNVRTALANHFASGVLELNDKLGPHLWQLPANFRSMPSASASFSTCCRAIPRRLPRSRASMTTACPARLRRRRP